MTIPLQARLVDLANLVVAKGSNFLLTVLLFALLARGMDSHAFAEFGYWWSMALMAGGVLLGGLASALVRVAALHGSLRHLIAPLRRALVGLGVLAAVLVPAALALPQHARLVMLLAAVALFGIAVQAQTVVLALLRATEATRANLAASAAIVLLVPLALHLLLGPQRALPEVFALLAAAFGLGTLAALAIAQGPLRHLFAPSAGEPSGVAGFLANVSSFTAVNVFSYAIVNVDFTLFRQIGSSAEFAQMGSAKVFFERFVLPALLVFAGAVSLRVLRHPQGTHGATARLQFVLGPRAVAGLLGAALLLGLGYELFVHTLRAGTPAVALPWAASAAAGYLLFALNGILFDVLVVRRSLGAVVLHVVAFLLLGCAVQTVAIGRFGVPGWAIGWLLFNMAVFAVLAREGMQWRLPEPGTVPADKLPMEDR